MNLEREFNLSGSQGLIWTGQLLQPDDPLYNMALAFEIDGPVDFQLFQEAFQVLVNHCDILRLIIVADPSRPRQKVLQKLDYKVELVDFSAETEPRQLLRAWLERQVVRMFDLSGVLFESVLIKLAADRFVWYFNQHHVCTDAWSTSVLYQAMQRFYGLARRGRLCEAEPLPTFQAYIQQELVARESVQWQRAKAYWSNKLKAGFQPSTFYRPVPAQRRAETKRIECRFGCGRSKRLKQLARESGFVAFTPELALVHLFLTTLFAYLYRTTGNDSLSIGTPTHNRTGSELKRTAGLFIEIFPVIVGVDEGDSFRSLHRKVSLETQQLLINTAAGVSGTEHNRAFDVVLNFITASFGEFDGLAMQSDWIHAGYGDRNHLLRLQVHNFDRDDEFNLHFDLNCDTFVGADQDCVVKHFLVLLDAFLDNPSQLIDIVPLGSSKDLPRLQPVHQKSPGTAVNVVEQFFRCVDQFPHRIALCCGDRNVSYTVLNADSNRLAHYLITQGIGTGSVVAVCIDRSIEVVTALWGILKTGAAYVPIDSAYPDERIEFILEDSGSTAVITRGSAESGLFTSSVIMIPLDKALAANEHSDVSNPGVCFEANALAYIIYTSGSSGRPKGVGIKHSGLENYIRWTRSYYLDGDLLDFPLFTTLSFDLTVTSIFTPLTSGSRLVVYPATDQRMNGIQAVIEDNAVDVIKLTPSHLALIQSMDLSASRVRKLIVGGEDFKTDLARTIERRFGGKVEVYNEYGPTEGTVACMIHRFDSIRDEDRSVPIGRSIDHVEVYLLDRHLHPVPQGLIGEIYIAGAGVANGYVNDANLTAECFVDNPFEPGQRMYASGDLARCAADGEMHYLGRRDNQVKVRGVRVELGEIETVLTGYAEIRESVVVPLAIQDSLEGSREETFCSLCGLSGNHPDAELDAQGVCSICRSCESQPDKTQGYFRDLDELTQILAGARAKKHGKYDCIMLLSGGKDSSYVLCKLVDMGMTPLVFTLDNGYISDGAKANIRRLVDDLSLDLHVGETAAMNAIFVESLRVHSNVCNGCFKTIYTLSMKLAHDLGIHTIVTGLSRGQIFETRLADLFRQDIVDPNEIDRTIIEARKAYHRLDDQVSRNFDTSHFKRDEIFNQIQFVDFYRYCDVTLEEVLAYLKHKVGWVRPVDTGRSTNCLINEAGIYVHKKERGYHNYALPYSWDVRLGHKEMSAAREELNDQINVDAVQRILDDIGYQGESVELVTCAEDRLVAYYVSDKTYSSEELRNHLATCLPKEYRPAVFIKIEQLPLTQNAKVDRSALPIPESFNRDIKDDFIPPENATERQLAEIWSSILRVDRVSRTDNFFDLGGDSILNIQIVALAQKQGLAITPQMIFDYPTVAELAQVVRKAKSNTIDQSPVLGGVALTPIQHCFFERKLHEWLHYNQAVLLEVVGAVDEHILQQAMIDLIRHHDALRSCFAQQSGHWVQSIIDDSAIDCTVLSIDLRGEPSDRCDAIIDRQITEAHGDFNPAAGHLLKVIFFKRVETEPDRLLLVFHRLIVDGVSMWILLDDLERLCEGLSRSQPVELPDKTSSYQAWSQALHDYATSSLPNEELEFWLRSSESFRCLPVDFGDSQSLDQSPQRVSVSLNCDDTRLLLHKVPGRLHSQISEILMVPMLQAMYHWTGNKTLCVAMEGHGRESLFEGIDLLRTVGWFTSIYPLYLKMPTTGELLLILRSIKEKMRAVPNRGIGFGILRYLSENAELREKLEALHKPELFFSYLGQWDQALAKSSNFRFARPLIADIGERDRLTYSIEINAMIYKGCLQLDWNFDQTKYKESTIRAVAEDFMVVLQKLINQSGSAVDNGLTPSDFPDADLDQASLDALIDDFGESL